MRDVVEKRPDVAARFAARRLDLDHIGAEIAEQLAAELSRFIRKFENPQTRERPRNTVGCSGV